MLRHILHLCFRPPPDEEGMESYVSRFKLFSLRTMSDVFSLLRTLHDVDNKFQLVLDLGFLDFPWRGRPYHSLTGGTCGRFKQSKLKKMRYDVRYKVWRNIYNYLSSYLRQQIFFFHRDGKKIPGAWLPFSLKRGMWTSSAWKFLFCYRL